MAADVQVLRQAFPGLQDIWAAVTAALAFVCGLRHAKVCSRYDGEKSACGFCCTNPRLSLVMQDVASYLARPSRESRGLQQQGTCWLPWDRFVLLALKFLLLYVISLLMKTINKWILVKKGRKTRANDIHALGKSSWLQSGKPGLTLLKNWCHVAVLEVWFFFFVLFIYFLKKHLNAGIYVLATLVSEE